MILFLKLCIFGQIYGKLLLVFVLFLVLVLFWPFWANKAYTTLFSHYGDIANLVAVTQNDKFRKKKLFLTFNFGYGAQISGQ